MSGYDHNEQQITTVATSMTMPFLGRSHSAPHIQSSNYPQDYFILCRPAISNTNAMHSLALSESTSSASYHTYLQTPFQQFSSPHSHPLSQLPQMASKPIQFTTTDPSVYNNDPTFQSISSVPIGHDYNNTTGFTPTHTFKYQSSIHPLQLPAPITPFGINEASNKTTPQHQTLSECFHPSKDIQDTGTSSSRTPTTPTAEDFVVAFDQSVDISPSQSFRCTRGYSTSSLSSLYESTFSRFEVPNEYPLEAFPRHASLGSLYPMTESHELLEAAQAPLALPIVDSAPMLPTASSTSISSTASMNSLSSNGSISSASSSTTASTTSTKVRARRSSLNPDILTREFTCPMESCGRLFKRSEHLKRHIRSVHTQDKPFGCPVLTCTKRFSRSDNLNQHIRIHRHDKEKSQANLVNFTLFHAPPVDE
ncbi:hypothetical protein BX616_000551 [Lobosporangium transversale]|nr:hypothetical protein BX616_000551 [Lobosporangium transversale]